MNTLTLKLTADETLHLAIVSAFAVKTAWLSEPDYILENDLMAKVLSETFTHLSLEQKAEYTKVVSAMMESLNDPSVERGMYLGSLDALSLSINAKLKM